MRRLEEAWRGVGPRVNLSQWTFRQPTSRSQSYYQLEKFFDAFFETRIWIRKGLPIQGPGRDVQIVRVGVWYIPCH